MELFDKLSLLHLDEKEEKKAKKLFIQDLHFVSDEELKEILELLEGKGVVIKNAREIKVLTNSKNELQKDFDILEEDWQMFRQDPNMLNRNVIDLHKMKMYYDQKGISYRSENGEYDLSMFSEDAWRKISMNEETKTADVEEDIVTLEPSVEDNNNSNDFFDKLDEETFEPVIDDESESKSDELVNFSDLISEEEEKPLFQKVDEVEETPAYSMYDELEKDQKIDEEDKINESVDNFANIRAELESQLKELDNIKESQNNDSEIEFDDNLSNIVGFNDINPETYDDNYNMGGRAA